MAAARFEIEILNWEKFNPRKELKSTSWLRLSNSIFEDPDFFDFNHAELLVWIYVLSLASKKNKPAVSINPTHSEKIGRINNEDLLSALSKLEQIQCIKITQHADVTHTTRARNVDDTLRTNERNETNVTNVTKRDVSGAHAHVSHAKLLKLPQSKTLGSKIWDSFSDAYVARYKIEPLRNQTTNSQCTQLAKRLGEDALEVVEFYLKHNDGFYLKAKHSINLCLRDAEALYTQWKQGRATTSSDVREFERTDHFRAQLDRVERGEL